MTSGRAIGTLPAAVAEVIVDLVPNLVAVPLIDASPACCALVWHLSRSNTVVAGLVRLARATGAQGSPDLPGAAGDNSAAGAMRRTAAQPS
jgi:hypothetical protein